MSGAPARKGPQQVVLVGHPFAPFGMGEQGAAALESCLAAGLDARMMDVFGHWPRRDPDLVNLVAPREAEALNEAPRIFHLNGDEAGEAIDTFADRGGDFAAQVNAISPAWELDVYPEAYKAGVERFDAAFAISRFVEQALKATLDMPVFWTGQSVERRIGPAPPRRYFGIRESAYAFYTSFDPKSYSARKNPEAVIETFRRLCAKRPWDDIVLVLKTPPLTKTDADRIADLVADPRIHVLSEHFPRAAMTGLMAACDAYVSLHRSEGFGRPPGEAMWLGKACIATAWSGNMDYMTPDGAFGVDYTLTPVAKGDYPHSEGRSWAEPDLDHALARMMFVLDHPQDAATVRRRGMLHVRTHFSNRAVGLRTAEALAALAQSGVSR